MNYLLIFRGVTLKDLEGVDVNNFLATSLVLLLDGRTVSLFRERSGED